jgi:hypothetical protein
MPLRKRRSRNAKAQRASRKRGFDSGLTDDPFEKLLDPDYQQSDEDLDTDSDSEHEELDRGFVFCMADNAVVQGDEGEPQGAAEDEDELTDFEEEGVLTAIESLKSVEA